MSWAAALATSSRGGPPIVIAATETVLAAVANGHDLAPMFTRLPLRPLRRMIASVPGRAEPLRDRLAARPATHSGSAV
jgi:hypothetical protein